MLTTQFLYLGNILLIFDALTITCGTMNRYFNAQSQIDAKYCMHHNFTYSGVSLLQCAALCVKSDGCRTVVYKAPTRMCFGCGYVMDFYYADQYEKPVDIPSGSVLYTLALSGYNYIGYYADCGPYGHPATTCDSGNRTLPLMFDSIEMTPALCFEHCEQYGTRYFGPEAWQFCMCGMVYDKYGTTSSPTSTCAGDETKICGGQRALSVYESLIKD